MADTVKIYPVCSKVPGSDKCLSSCALNYTCPRDRVCQELHCSALRLAALCLAALRLAALRLAALRLAALHCEFIPYFGRPSERLMQHFALG